MAITKIIPMKAHPRKGIEYICNPNKTDGELYISCSKCTPETSDFDFNLYRHRYNRNTKKEYNEGTKAYHLIQSFKPNEVSSEEAHRIGQEYADKLFGGKYAYVVATHIDKGHIHNHIIFSAYSVDGKSKYDSNIKEKYHRMELSDQICKANGLSVVKSRGRGKKYNEWSASKNKSSWKDKIKETIDKNISSSNSYDEFIEKMQAANIVINDKNKYITFRPADKERPVRGNKLGKEYSRENIKARIKNKSAERNTEHQEADNIFTDFEFNEEIIDTSTDKFKNSVGLNRWAKKQNLQTADELFNIMRQQGFSSIENLRDYITEQELKAEDYNEVIDYCQQSIIQCQDNINYIKNYQAYKKLTYGLNQTNDKDAFKEKYKNQLRLYYEAEQKLNESDITDINDDTIDELNLEIENLTIHQSEIKKQLKSDTDKDLPELKKLLRQIELYLGHQPQNIKTKTNDWEL